MEVFNETGALEYRFQAASLLDHGTDVTGDSVLVFFPSPPDSSSSPSSPLSSDGPCTLTAPAARLIPEEDGNRIEVAEAFRLVWKSGLRIDGETASWKANLLQTNRPLLVRRGESRLSGSSGRVATRKRHLYLRDVEGILAGGDLN